ncbi:coiled-coil domain-containing protein 69-like [Pristis pectinata]|uniref:coiled-coil domain-containing protein 69-like n=1 Tax=Pristis pectinata TaxID=685728 RepID=UPI00223DAEDC|nr:coiled-coil domain-containing protein 69-like [Pristis pectinata]
MGSSNSKLCCCKSRKKKEAQSKQHKEVSQELAALHGDGDLPGAACNQLQKAEAFLLERHEKEVQRIREEHEEELAQLREDLCSTYNTEKQQLQYLHAEEIEKLKQELQKKEGELSDSRIVELKGRHSEYVKSLKEECETALAGLVKQHKQEQESLTESFEKANMCLKERIEELTTQVNSFQMKTKKIEDAILRRGLNRDDKNLHPPTLFWEQELESLHFVVEMKNERIHQLDKQVLQMKNLVEVNILLEEKVKTLQQENEDLKVRLKSQQDFARQLSMEHEALQQTLEKEAMMKERLFHEKEELVWKLQNGDGSPTGEISLGQLHSESIETSLR